MSFLLALILLAILSIAFIITVYYLGYLIGGEKERRKMEEEE